MNCRSESRPIANGHKVNAPVFHTDLHKWWADRGRSFPWREITDPFHVLLAEMMLRRTRADQVVAVYCSFIERYPGPDSLAFAEPEEVAASLYSLGLAWRVPAFQELSRVLLERYCGQVPARYNELVSLPGVGDYVASALRCFAFEQPVTVIDTNTVRVIGRIFGIPTNPESRRRRSVRDLLHAMLDKESPASYNYALLDLAALICRPKSPLCHRCPVVRHCKTGLTRTGRVQEDSNCPTKQ